MTVILRAMEGFKYTDMEHKGKSVRKFGFGLDTPYFC